MLSTTNDFDDGSGFGMLGLLKNAKVSATINPFLAKVQYVIIKNLFLVN
jgi:hypothetical protein